VQPRVVASAFDFSDHKAAAYAPQTLDMYLAFLDRPHDRQRRPRDLRGRLLLISDGEYTREGLAIRGRDFHAIDTISPFPLKFTWEALDEGL
jgi:hypothetical protein